MNKQQRQVLTAAVVKLQNSALKMDAQDHVTITGFFTTLKEFMNHIDNLSIRVFGHEFEGSYELETEFFDLEAV